MGIHFGAEEWHEPVVITRRGHVCKISEVLGIALGDVAHGCLQHPCYTHGFTTHSYA